MLKCRPVYIQSPHLTFNHRCAVESICSSKSDLISIHRSKCIQSLIMTLPARVYPEPLQGAGSDSPQALLAERTDNMTDSEDDDDDRYIPAVIDNKVSKVFSRVKGCPRLRGPNVVSFCSTRLAKVATGQYSI